ncbi:MAG TPA: hypothetical protein VFX12_01085 [Vicinamibacterales bacterium]|nr:hypothetical protein [Vicinamibacterales bacterium]
MAEDGGRRAEDGGRIGGDMKGQQKEEADQHEGAVESDRPDQVPQHGNANAPALNEEGLPADDVKIAEDVLGANLDETQG